MLEIILRQDKNVLLEAETGLTVHQQHLLVLENVLQLT